MSRSGYSEGYEMENWSYIRWRGQVASAIRGRRGQAFLRELVDALDAMPEKRLISNNLEHAGNVCAIGSVGLSRGEDMSQLDPHDYDSIAAKFGIAHQLVQEIEWENDEVYGEWGKWDEKACRIVRSDEGRWKHMRAWAIANLKPENHP